MTVELTCVKCLAPVAVEVSMDSVTCAKCGSVMDVVSDSWWDGEDDHAILYLELPET